MYILHYSLGFPPYRTGGMTKFCVDLMMQQKQEGHAVGLMWPGHYTFFRNKQSVKQTVKEEVDSFEIINPNPVSYDEGIKAIKKYVNKGEEKFYSELLDRVSPDIIHVHTLMGLHPVFLYEAKRRGIKLVFTAHDFFPICPKVTMYKNGCVCPSVNDCKECPDCNKTALPMWKNYLLQSGVYRFLKDSLLMKKLRSRHRNNYLSGDAAKSKKSLRSANSPENYVDLRAFYVDMLKSMDVIHYNSILTKRVYESIIGERNSVVLPITHSHVVDNRIKRNYRLDKSVLNISYLGPYSGAKGYFVLKEALDAVWREGKKFSLNVFFESPDQEDYIISHERYDYNELKKIMSETDVLIVPSVWYETFGYTVLEALSNGVPVIITENVGAKDIVPEGGGIIVPANDSETLSEVIFELDFKKLEEMNRIINEKAEIQTMKVVSELIWRLCYS